MLTKTARRRPLSLLLLVLGGLLMFLAPATWPGVVVLGAGILLELLGIALTRRGASPGD